MQELTVFLLGQGRFYADGKQVVLPFKQAEALLYYLLLEKSAFRPKIADIIWGDSQGEERIKSNMRNAIYVIRKAFGSDFLLRGQGNTIQINPAIKINRDIDQLERDDVRCFDFYAGDFLEDFSLKDNEYYNEWLLNTRQYFRHEYQKRLNMALQQFFAEGNYTDGEAICRRLIALDEFDESSYACLIEIYRRRGEYSSAITLFNQMEKLLAEELFLAPSRELADLIQVVKQERNEKVQQAIAQKRGIIQQGATVGKPFYGRTTEKGKVAEIVTCFIEGGHAKSVAVTGEAGIGKTCLFQNILHETDDGSILLFQTCCYRAEEHYILKPWQTVFEQMNSALCKMGAETENSFFRTAVSHIFPFLYSNQFEPIDQDEITTEHYDSNQRAITYALIRLSKQKRLIFYFDDLQWADAMTISLLRDVLTSAQNDRILFLLSCRDERHQYVSSFLEDMRSAGFISEIKLKRFGFSDTIGLANMLLPEQFNSYELQRRLFRETEGNPFFIIETVNNIKFNGSVGDITPNMRDTIRLRTMLLPPEEKNILSLLSFFFDGATFDMLLALSNKEEYDLINILESLMGKQLIREVKMSDEVVFQFGHQKILEYVYGELSMTKRRILHERIAACFEKQLHNDGRDAPVYAKLMYHFDRAGNQRKYLKYHIEYVYCYLNLSHEYYPILGERPFLTGQYDELNLPDTNKDAIFRLLNNIKGLVEKNLEEFSDEDGRGFLSDYYHMMGRYHIRKVEYVQGEPYIRRLIELNRGVNTEQCRNNMIKAYRQLICIYIDRYETDKMREVIDAAVEVLNENSKAEERAIWLRLSGLWAIMSGRIREGREYLHTAVSIFESSPEKQTYLFNLAASYAWLGEADRKSMNYVSAMQYYQQAINICTKNYLTGGIATFYTYAGQAAFDSGDMDEADYYLSQAVEQFNKVELMWGRGIAFAYYGLLHIVRGRDEEAISLFVKAEDYAHRLDSRYELGVINRIYAQLCRKVEKQPMHYSAIAEYLKEKTNVYYHRAKACLEEVFSPVDHMYLDQIEKERKEKSNQEEQYGG